MPRRAPQEEVLFDLPIEHTTMGLGAGALTLMERAELTNGPAAVLPASANLGALPVESQPATGWPLTPVESKPIAERTVSPRVSLAERLHVVRDTVGFLPTSKGEINEAFTLLDYAHTPGGAAKRLNEVLKHQQKAATADPAAALRSITREYAGYASRARFERFQLAAMGSELAEYVGRGNSNLGTLRGVGDLTGSAQFVRYHDLSRLAETGEEASVSSFMARVDGRRSALDPYTVTEPSNEMNAHLQSTLESVRVWQAQAGLDTMVDDQQNRFDFWTERLREARTHAAARPVANAALQSLGVEA